MLLGLSRSFPRKRESRGGCKHLDPRFRGEERRSMWPPPMRPRKALEVLSFCGAEQRTLCGNVPPGGGRIIECLAANYTRLSPECYGALARAAR